MPILAALLAAMPVAPACAADELTAYVKARAAAADGAVELAAAGYAEALAADPDNALIAIRAFREGVAAGDLALARRALGVLEAAKVAPADGAVLRIADALAAGDGTAAAVAAERLADGPLDFIGPVVEAWVAFDRKGTEPFAILDAAQANALTRRYAAENRALLLIASGHTQQGVDALKALLGSDPASLDLRLNAAEMLAGKGKRKLALALLAGPDPELARIRDSLGRGTKPTAALGVARLLVRLGADLNREETAQLSILLARTALILEPGNDRARILLAGALSRDGANDRALAMLEPIAPQGVAGPAADALRVAILSRAGAEERALSTARALANAPAATAADAQNWGDLLLTEERYAEAAGAYALALERGRRDDWIVHLQLGGALEQAGRWEEALPHLERAVALAPEEPVALNYLGYAQAERGANLPEALALLEKASRLRPDDPSITDSLGWGYFQAGDTAKALPLLERAARGDPGNTTINEHLGDAYWRAGRRIDARYAWRAAAVYAEGEDATRIAGKLTGGLQATAAR